MKRERLTIWEAAAFLAELPLQREVDLECPFPPMGPLKKKAHPKIKKWFNRVRVGTQSGTLAHYRDDNNPRGIVYYHEDDLRRFFKKLFQRQEVIDP